MIHATCHTADNVRCIEFDATPWFNEADAPSIIDLAQRGWVSTAIADFLERRRGYERLHDLVEYAAKRLQPESLEDPTWETFECVVDRPDAVAWLEKSRCGEDPLGHGKRSNGDDRLATSSAKRQWRSLARATGQACYATSYQSWLNPLTGPGHIGCDGIFLDLSVHTRCTRRIPTN
jgi:hypothetical protein